MLTRSETILFPSAETETLTGCIAPGKDKTNTGITQSDEAIEELFYACDGVEDKKDAATLQVLAGPRLPIISNTIPDFGGIFGGDNNSQSTTESSTGNMSDLKELLNY